MNIKELIVCIFATLVISSISYLLFYQIERIINKILEKRKEKEDSKVIAILNGKYYRVSKRKLVWLGDIIFDVRRQNYYKLKTMEDVEYIYSIDSELYTVLKEI